MSAGMSIKAKMIAGFGFLMAVLIGIGIYGNAMITRVNEKSNQIAGNWLPRVQTVEKIKTLVSEYRRWELTYIISTDTVEMAEAEKMVQQANANIQKEWENYDRLITSEDERTLYNNLINQWTTYRRLSENVFLLRKSDMPTLAMAVVKGESEVIHEKIVALLDTISKLSGEGADRAREESESIYASTRTTSIIVIAVGLLAALAASYLLAKNIVRPTRVLLSAAKGMAGGDLNRRVEASTSDELGDLSRAFNEMSDNLRAMVGQIVDSAGTLAAGSQQLSASAQEVSAAIDEMASTTAGVMEESEKSATGSREAAGRAGAVMDLADRGMASVQDTEGAMRLIQDSSANAAESVKKLSDHSRQIGNITELITAIAEQTNLLALNAAIEAARAGEQGKGFAVVADEVRKLAEQSAGAAKDIASLITQVQQETMKAVRDMESVRGQVDGGARVVRDTGALFEEILQEVRETVASVSGVVEGSARSAGGIHQISTTIAQINAVVQQVAASAQDMAKMSGELQGLVTKFRL